MLEEPVHVREEEHSTDIAMDVLGNNNQDSSHAYDTEIGDPAGNVQRDDILIPNPNRFTLFPIKHHDLWRLYKTAQNSNWIAEEIKLDKDLDDWNNRLTEQERYYIEHILAFFAQADGIVNENLLLRFENDVQYLEAKCFYRFQGMIENVHAEVYAMFIDVYVSDPEKRDRLFNAIDNVPCVHKKAEWALRWIESDEASFGERLLAFACVEGIFFSGSFAAIFWLRKRGLLKGLSQANTLISRDEGLHQIFACTLYRRYLHHNKPSTERAYQIVKEACELEKNFQTEALPVSLIGINRHLMAQYIEYVSDVLLKLIGLDPLYNTPNPLDFMDLISMLGVANFFEEPETSYRMGLEPREWSVNEDF